MRKAWTARVPAFEVLSGYGWADARADVVAGLSVAAVALPQAVAYALVAGVPAQHGLYTAIVMTAVGAIFDSSRQLINGPTNAISIAVFSALAAATTPDERLAGAVLLGFLIGAFQVGITLLRLGDLTRYVSHSVVTGFTLGAGTLVVLEQVRHLLGLTSVGDAHDPFLWRFWRTVTEGGPIHPATAMVGVGAIVAVLALRALKARMGWTLLPEFFLVVAASAWVAAALDLEGAGVKVLGEVPASLPSFAWPSFDAVQMQELSGSALAIATLGLLEAVAMAKAIAARTKQRLDLNQQCLSEGLANLTGSFFQCIPGSGSLTRSAINVSAGARTQWSGVVSAAAVAVALLTVAPYARYIPRPALAGIVMVSAVRMVDWGSLRFALRATTFDRILIGVTAVSALAISVEFCILIGVFLSFLLAVPRVGRILFTEFVVTPAGRLTERLAEDEPDPRCLIFGLDGQLFFGASMSLEGHLDTITDRIRPQTRVVVLRMKRVVNPDAVCLHQLDDFIEHVTARGVTVILAGVREGLGAALQRLGIVGDGRVEVFLEEKVRFSSTEKALERAQALLVEG